MSSSEPVREWVGGRFTMPARIEAMGDRRAEMSLWVELPDLQVVGQVLEDPNDPQATFGQSLMRAMSSPLVGVPRRPQIVRVADSALAAQLKSFSFLKVEVAPTPEFDRVVRSLGAFFGAGSYFSDPSLTQKDLGALFIAARALWAARPWTLVDDDALIQVEVPALGISDGCVSIVGALDEVHGFALFPSYEDYDCMQESAGNARESTPLAPHNALYFSFASRDDVSEAMRTEVAEHGWPLADEDAYPILLRIVEGKPAPVFEPEVRLATAVMRALAACVLRHPQAFESYGEVEIRESHFDEDDLEVIVSVPHPLAALDDAPGRPERAQTLSVENPYRLPFETNALKDLERTLRPFTLHRLMGLFCALGSVPELVSPKVWLGEILQEAQFASEAQFRSTVEPLMLAYNHVVATLEGEDIDGLVPEAADVEACRQWAAGYTALLGRIDPAQMEGDVLDAAFAIQALAEIPQMLTLLDEFRGDKSREAMFALYRDSLADDADFLLDAWTKARAHAAAATSRRAAPKVGRNDPCPCGSGKKHKKCCATS